jgi:hypothetical protein
MKNDIPKRITATDDILKNPSKIVHSASIHLSTFFNIFHVHKSMYSANIFLYAIVFFTLYKYSLKIDFLISDIFVNI